MIDSDDDLQFELDLPIEEPSQSSFNNIPPVAFETLDNASRPSSSSPSIKENKKSDKQRLIPDRASSVTGIPSAPPLPYNGKQSQRITVPKKPKHRNVEGFFYMHPQSASPALINISKPSEFPTSSPIAQKTLVMKPVSNKYNASLFSEPVAISAPTVPSVQEDDVALTFTEIFGEDLTTKNTSVPRSTLVRSGLFKYSLENPVATPVSSERFALVENHVAKTSVTPTSSCDSSFSSNYTSDVGSVDPAYDTPESAYDTPSSSPQWQRISLSPEERDLSTPAQQEHTFPNSAPNNPSSSDEDGHGLNDTSRFSPR
jgi:hypothetical protein